MTEIYICKLNETSRNKIFFVQVELVVVVVVVVEEVVVVVVVVKFYVKTDEYD